MRRGIVWVAAAVVLSAVAACTAPGISSAGGTAALGGPTDGTATAARTGARAATPGANLDGRGASILFAQMVLLHHRQSVQLVAMLEDKSGVPAPVLEWAHRVREIEEAETEPLVGWLQEWRAPETLTNHTGHPMRGILIDVQLAALQALDGVDFTRQWVGRMIDHQEGGAAFASTMLAQLPDPRVAQLAQSLASRLPQQALELRALQ